MNSKVPTKATVYRQGDVILLPLKPTDLPKGVEQVKPDKGRVILAYGEVTGHAHALPMKAAVQYKVGSGSNAKEFVETKQPTNLTHEEHAPIELPEGLYQKIIAREYTPGGERQVLD
ncbi:MAG: hypothetical protein K2X77_18380 [Candidatus Obscuribacterales bacterium]|nr:hypothetical protein [Candidatus Obscuribacterales bacterium]